MFGHIGLKFTITNPCFSYIYVCRHKNKFKLFWLGATEAPSLDKNKDIDLEWFLV